MSSRRGGGVGGSRSAKNPPCKATEDEGEEGSSLVTTLRRVDPLLRFLTKATGRAAVAMPVLRKALPEQLRRSSAAPAPRQRRTATTGGCPGDGDALLRDLEALAELGALLVTRTTTQGRGEDDGGGAAAPSRSAAPNDARRQRQPLSWDDANCSIGFPLPTGGPSGSLHGSTEAGARRRLAALKRLLKEERNSATKGESPASNGINGADPIDVDSNADEMMDAAKKDALSRKKEWDCSVRADEKEAEEDLPVLKEEREARIALAAVFGFGGGEKSTANAAATASSVLPARILPKQASYAGSHSAQDSVFADLPPDTLKQIPDSLLGAFGLHRLTGARDRRLYRHQAAAVEAALKQQHCTVCTGTGSGKSLCFLLPVLAAACNTDATSLVLFPTKALAQDQLSKLRTLLAAGRPGDLSERIRPAALDGDTPHPIRAAVAAGANVVLTNPDALHAAVLPNWRRRSYATMLGRLRYVVLDEAHVYEGCLGAHVAMVLSRLVRVVAAAAAATREGGRPLGRRVTFLAASATLPWPERHFRLLCPVARDENVTVLTGEQDGSPRSAKHFFVWNPPVLKADGSSTDRVTFSRPAGDATAPALSGKKRPREATPPQDDGGGKEVPTGAESGTPSMPDGGTTGELPGPQRQQVQFHRRHAADETALLLALAIANGVRCIAFCKTRNLVEWVYGKALEALKGDPKTAHLASKLESYRGGYSMKERRKIEKRLFQNDLIGVVGTNALELGVDVGGVDLTLHCGYPFSYASLLQQAGRAGRCKDRLNMPSFSVVVCFNSPSEQHIWRHPASLLGKGISAPSTIPIGDGLVQGHLLCASEEFPLTGELPVTAILGPHQDSSSAPNMLPDRELFGGDLYSNAVQTLCSSRSLIQESIALPSDSEIRVQTFRAHASLRRPWTRVSIRSIEPVNYSVVNISHPSQGGKMDGIHDNDAIMDTLPYSRVFYHAHPGAIIQHRAKRYKIIAMTSPPPFAAENFSYRRNVSLAAYATPTNARYVTRPLSKLQITVVKQMESVELCGSSSGTEMSASNEANSEKQTKAACTLAGCGAVSVKREVHGYKKLSLITRQEMSRSELSLPPIEYDTFGLYINIEVDQLIDVLGEAKYGPGVHALSHALLAVAPLFAPGLSRGDLECDHSFVRPTRVMLFDERAGGSGCVQRLWKCFFQRKSILESAINLLEECSFCSQDTNYDGGCPACLHASNCLKFNMHLSRSAAIVIGKSLLKNLQATDLYKSMVTDKGALSLEEKPATDTTPRRKARRRALQKAKEMSSSRERQFVVGRPSWPLD